MNLLDDYIDALPRMEVDPDTYEVAEYPPAVHPQAAYSKQAYAQPGYYAPQPAVPLAYAAPSTGYGDTIA